MIGRRFSTLWPGLEASLVHGMCAYDQLIVRYPVMLQEEPEHSRDMAVSEGAEG